jgi:hypothetical protein
MKVPMSDQIVLMPLFRKKNTITPELHDKEIEDFLGEKENNIFDISIKRNSSGSVVDFEIDFHIHQIYFYYRALMIKIIYSFTSLRMSSNEELKMKAWDKFHSVKENTGEKLQQHFYQTTNLIRLSIHNPKVIIPFAQNNDLKSPAYVLSLGNLNLSTNEENANEENYEYINISLEGTQFQYFKSMSLWHQYEVAPARMTFAGFNNYIFSIIEELAIHFKIGRRK